MLETDAARARRASRSTTAAAVSSQLVSIPSTAGLVAASCVIARVTALRIGRGVRTIQRRQRVITLDQRSNQTGAGIGDWRWTPSEHRHARQPLALAQAHEVRARLMAAHGLGRGRLRDRRDLDDRRPHPGPAARRGRRQGPVHQGDRGGAARRAHRHRRPFVQGHADRAAGGAGSCRPFWSARIVRDAFIGRDVDARSTTCPRAPSSAPRRCAARRCCAARGPTSKVVDFRGNVQTRLRKLEDGVADATLLAAAGLNRLGLMRTGNGIAARPRGVSAGARRRARSASRAASATGAIAELVAPLDHAETGARASPASGPSWRRSTAPAARRSPAMP